MSCFRCDACLFCLTSWSGDKSQRKQHNLKWPGYSHWIWWCRISNSGGRADRSPCRWSSPAEIKTWVRSRKGLEKKRQSTKTHMVIEIKIYDWAVKMYKAYTRESLNVTACRKWFLFEISYAGWKLRVGHRGRRALSRGCMFREGRLRQWGG